MKALLSTLFLGICLVTGTAAVAAQQKGPITGMELNDWCASRDTTIQDGCLAYIGGFSGGFLLGQEMVALGYRPICMPAEVSASQMRLIVQKTMRDHPEFLNQNADLMVMKALSDAFQCKPGESPKYGQKPN